MSDVDLAKATVLITGASRGIGLATALRLAKTGARLFLLSRTQASIAAAEREARGLGAEVDTLAADLSEGSPALFSRIDAQLPGDGLDALVHAAGVCDLGSVEATGPEVLDAQWQVNLRSPYLLTGALLPRLRRSKGHVVFVNSGAGRVAKAGWSAYAASKHGLRALADALREEVSSDGIRVTSVYPGRTATGMQASVRAQEGKPYRPESFVQPADVAAVIERALRTPPPAFVEEVSVRPLPA